MIVADAAFGKQEAIAKVKAWGGTIFSMASNSYIWLWNTLKHAVPPNHWRAVVDVEGWIASVRIIVHKKQAIVTQQLLSNAFKPQVYQDNSPVSGSEASKSPSKCGYIIVKFLEKMPYWSDEALAKMTVATLKEICSKYNVPHCNTIISRYITD